MFAKKRPAGGSPPSAPSAPAASGQPVPRPVSVPIEFEGPACPNCGGTTYDAGKVATYFNEFNYQAAGTTGRVTPAAITARRCRSCFNLQLFAPPKSAAG
jgi:hypothetical protein